MVIASACVTLLAHRIDRAICGRLSAFQAVRQVVQKHVGAVRWRHRACTSSAAVVAVGASCTTAMAEGRTRPGVSVPRASGVIMSQPLDESRSDCPSSTLQVHAAMANALSTRQSCAAKFASYPQMSPTKTKTCHPCRFPAGRRPILNKKWKKIRTSANARSTGPPNIP